MLANDTDPDGGPLSAALVSRPSHGTLTFHADGSFRYTPVAGFAGTDQFTYRANVGALASGPATVTINVRALPRCRGLKATHVGTANADVLRGSLRADVIVTGGGDDIVFAHGGDDLVCAGVGDDRLAAGREMTLSTAQRGTTSCSAGRATTVSWVAPASTGFAAALAGTDRERARHSMLARA